MFHRETFSLNVPGKHFQGLYFVKHLQTSNHIFLDRLTTNFPYLALWQAQYQINLVEILENPLTLLDNQSL